MSKVRIVGPARKNKTVSCPKSEGTSAKQERPSAVIPITPSPVDRTETSKMLAEVTGVKDLELAARMLEQVSKLQAPWLFGNRQEGLKVAFEMMRELRPASVTEGMLAQQMVGVHHAALSYLFQAGVGGENAESYLLRATKLMRLFHEQAEVMAKLKGKVAHQEVRVEHVHIYKGGQAIVGAVDSAELNQGEGGTDEKQNKTP